MDNLPDGLMRGFANGSLFPSEKDGISKQDELALGRNPKRKNI